MQKISAARLVASTVVVLLAVGATGVDAAKERRNTTRSPNVCLPGDDSFAWCGDGGAATRARLAGPRAVAAVGDGGYLIADAANHVIRRVFPDRTIWTVTGTGVPGYSGDDGPATDARLNGPTAVVMAGDGGYLIADTGNHSIRRVLPDGTITTVAGSGEAGGSGDGGPATAARLADPMGLALAGDGSFLVADSGNHRIRRVSRLRRGRISTVAGSGAEGFAGDGGAATAAQLNDPADVAVHGVGGLLIADRGNHAIRHVQPGGTIATVLHGLDFPTAVAVTADGGFLFTDEAAVQRFHPDGSVTTVAGTGALGFDLDERPGAERAPATETELAYPTDVEILPDGTLLISVTSADRVLEVGGGSVHTVAGSGDVPALAERSSIKTAPRAPSIQPLGRPRKTTVERRRFGFRARITVNYRVSNVARVSAKIVLRDGRARARRARMQVEMPKLFECPDDRVRDYWRRQQLTCDQKRRIRRGTYVVELTASDPDDSGRFDTAVSRSLKLR